MGLAPTLPEVLFPFLIYVGPGRSAGQQLGLHNYLERVPEMMELLNAPAVARAVASIIGEGWAIVPWTHNLIVAGSSDQVIVELPGSPSAPA